MEETHALEYNTERPKMHIPEYGRNVQKMVDHAISIADRDERNKVAQAIIKVMGELNPHLRDVEEYKPKLWTHLFIMSEFKLDVDSPYPIPKKEQLMGKPNRVKYPQVRIKYGHYGKNIELMIEEACKIEDEKEREALGKTVGKMMKRFHLTYNTSTLDDNVIGLHLRQMSNGKIDLQDLSFLPGTNEVLKSIGSGPSSTPKHRGKGGKKRKNRSKNRKRN